MRRRASSAGAFAGIVWPGVAADAVGVAALIVVALGLAAVAGLPLWAGCLVVVPVSTGTVWHFHRDRAPFRFGLANWVTLFRLNLVALLLLVALTPDAAGALPSWTSFAIAAAALLLDGVDGWLARRRREASGFGARFDMAADTALTVVLSWCLVGAGLVGAWVLVIGLLRPAFVVGRRFWPALARPLPASRGRKVVGAAALCCLVAGLAPPLAASAPVLAVTALLLLSGSFGRDLRQLVRRADAAC